mgnify:CR=1 FL=1
MEHPGHGSEFILQFRNDTKRNCRQDVYIQIQKFPEMLKEARELGIVEISIKEPWERDLNLEKKFSRLTVSKQ